MRAVKRFKPRSSKRVFPVTVTHTEPQLGLVQAVQAKPSPVGQSLERQADQFLARNQRTFSAPASNRAIIANQKILNQGRKTGRKSKV